MKVVVYAIAKNEAKFAERWMASMREADEVVVLDTGSTDGTAEALRRLGAKVENKVMAPWRFDVARNESIDLAKRLVPDVDILVCTDLDEVFLPGWREKLETAWSAAVGRGEHPTTAQYEYVWNFNADGSAGTKFWYEKIHRPDAGRWTHPVHEILEYGSAQKRIVRVDDMRLEHHADPAKSRGQYLALLEMSVKESPLDDRYMHYLGREYMFNRRWDEAIATLKRHLELPTAKWREERAASMRFIARCYGAKGDALRQEVWLHRAILEAPRQREAALELAELAYKAKDWPRLVRTCEHCLSIKTRSMTYLTEAAAWGARPWDLYALGLWCSGRLHEAIDANCKAMEFDPSNKRLRENDIVMRAAVFG